MSQVETSVTRSYIMFVDTVEQSMETRLDFATSRAGLRADSSRTVNGTESAKTEVTLDNQDLVSEGVLAFHEGFVNFVAEHSRAIMILVKGDPEAIARSLASTAIPEEMKVTYPPLPEPQI